MFLEAVWGTTVAYSNDRAYWRASSQICNRPEGRFVDEYECVETRPCYAEL